jgi:glycosyltransferase involved in cell wall biosynthesis
MRRTLLHLIDVPGPGGAETILLELAHRLDRDKWTSIVAVPAEGWISKTAAQNGITVEVLPVRHGPLDVAYLYRLLKLIRKHSVDIIHAHLLTPAFYGSAAAALRRIPIVCTFHGTIDIDSTRLLATKFKVLNRFANRVVFVSRFLRDNFLTRTPLSKDKTSVVYNGIGRPLRSPNERERIRASLDVRDGDVLVGAIGNVRHAKGYDTFLRAAALLQAESDHFKFVVAGAVDGEVFPVMDRLRHELQLDPAFRFLGFWSDPFALLSAFDVFVTSSTSEGFSLSCVQALAAGIPVVATRSGGPEEILGGDSGLLVDVANPSQMAEAIRMLADDPSLRQTLITAGLQKTAKSFSAETMVREYDTIYRQALGERADGVG